MSYDGAVNVGGHEDYFNSYGDIYSTSEVVEALKAVGGEAFVENFLSAVNNPQNTGELGEKTDEGFDPESIEDEVYYSMKPSLPEILQDYIVANERKVFDP